MLCAGKLKIRHHFQRLRCRHECVLFRHGAVDPKRGARLDAPEVSVYHVRDGKVLRSQMFHAEH